MPLALSYFAPVSQNTGNQERESKLVGVAVGNGEKGERGEGRKFACGKPKRGE